MINYIHVHHLDSLKEYVDPEEAERNMEIVKANPLRYELNRQPRKRDANRKTHKVCNPLFTSASACLVCKYQHKRRRETLKYCRECCVANFTHWPTTNRATGFAKEFHPRLCSKECFDYFHTHNIRGLDYAIKRQRSKSTQNTRTNTPSTSRRRNSNSSSSPRNITPTVTTRSPRNTNPRSTSQNTRYNV